jgi:hypothetical protein
MMIKETDAPTYACVRAPATTKCLGKSCMAWVWLHPTKHYIDANGVLQNPEVPDVRFGLPQDASSTIGFCGEADG